MPASLPARSFVAGQSPSEPKQIEIFIEGELLQKLNKLTADKPFLLLAVLMTALKICLYKYTGNEQVVVGTPARRRENDSPGETNALAILDSVRGRLSFKQLLLNVRQTLLEAYGKQRYPFNLLVTDLALAQVEGKCPLFDVALILPEIHGNLPETGNDIDITFSREPERITGRISFNADVYAGATVERFTKHLVNVLRSGLDDPDILISGIQMIDDAERRKLLLEWNGRVRSNGAGEGVHQLFEAQVKKSPAATALVLDGDSLSFAELDARANKLARYLRRLGVSSEVRVAVFLERSFDLFVSIFGVLKAGGAYVLLDPAYPAGRLGFMLEDSHASVILTRQSQLEVLPQNSARVVSLDNEAERIAEESGEGIESGVTGENLAYVIYTSGSTGQPKGVLVPHAALLNHALAAIDIYGIDSTHRLLQFLSPSFDAFAEELYPTLCSGAALVMHRRPNELAPLELIDFCQQQSVTSLHIPPAYLNQMCEELARTGRSVPEQVKLLITGGESLTGEVVQKWRKVGGEQARLLHAYGPSEATVTATVHEVQSAEERPGRVSIGRALGNVEVYVVDGEGGLAAIGAVGELYIGGMGVARGYEGKAEQTAERFVPDGWSGRGGGRVYRTGDMVRYSEDGELEFVGRVDDQIKLHGYRIEPGEIEEALRQYAPVKEAIVLLREDTPGARKLVAYILPERALTESAGAPGISEFRAFLQRSLPDYMLPAAYVMLDAWPTTPNGKVDKRSLPAPDQTRPELARPYVAPRTPTEEQLAAIWAELFKIERVGIHDDFLELGGHSLLAFQLVSRIRDAMHVELPLSSVFESPTIAQQATTIAQKIAAGGDAAKLEEMLEEIEHLSSDELERVLGRERRQQ
jgi:amino acid adenylation domain-containing protein